MQGAGNRDGKLSLYEIFQFAASRTRAAAEREGTRQHPFFEGAFTSDHDLVSINPEKLSELNRRYRSGEFVARPLGLNDQISIERYASAVEALGYGDIQRTIELCTEVLELQPKHQEAHRLRGIAYIATGDMINAFEDSDATGSRMKVRYTGTHLTRSDVGQFPIQDELLTAVSEPTSDGRLRKVHDLLEGNVYEIQKLNSGDSNYEPGSLMWVSGFRPKGEKKWLDLSGWVVAAAFSPSTVEGQLDILRDYQLEANQPVIDAGQAEQIQQSVRGAGTRSLGTRSSGSRNGGSRSLRGTNARGLIDAVSSGEVGRTIGQVRDVVNGIQSGNADQIIRGLGADVPAYQRGRQLYNGVRSGNPATIMRSLNVEPPRAYHSGARIYNSIRSGSPQSIVRSILSF